MYMCSPFVDGFDADITYVQCECSQFTVTKTCAVRGWEFELL